MKRGRTISLSRLGTALVLSALAGLQVGLYAADEFDDGVSDPLSFWIGIVILAIALWVGLKPFQEEEG